MHQAVGNSEGALVYDSHDFYYPFPIVKYD